MHKCLEWLASHKIRKHLLIINYQGKRTTLTNQVHKALTGHTCVIVQKCKIYAFVWHHTLLHESPFVVILHIINTYIYTYDHYPSTT